MTASNRFSPKKLSTSSRFRMSSSWCLKFFVTESSRSRFHVVSPCGPKKTARMLLSTPTTSWPCPSKYITASEPIKPLEPVTSIFINCPLDSSGEPFRLRFYSSQPERVFRTAARHQRECRVRPPGVSFRILDRLLKAPLVIVNHAADTVFATRFPRLPPHRHQPLAVTRQNLNSTNKSLNVPYRHNMAVLSVTDELFVAATNIGHHGRAS